MWYSGVLIFDLHVEVQCSINVDQWLRLSSVDEHGRILSVWSTVGSFNCGWTVGSFMYKLTVGSFIYGSTVGSFLCMGRGSQLFFGGSTAGSFPYGSTFGPLIFSSTDRYFLCVHRVTSVLFLSLSGIYSGYRRAFTSKHSSITVFWQSFSALTKGRYGITCCCWLPGGYVMFVMQNVVCSR